MIFKKQFCGGKIYMESRQKYSGPVCIRAQLIPITD